MGHRTLGHTAPVERLIAERGRLLRRIPAVIGRVFGKDPFDIGGQRCNLIAGEYTLDDDVPVDLVLQFPTFDSTPDALMSLAVGDELHLGLPTDRPLEVRVDGVLVARATIGRSGLRKACAITEEVFP